MLRYGLPLWLVCGIMAYAGEMGRDRIERPSYDALCRSVNLPAVCDARIIAKRSFFLIWGLSGGPIALAITGTSTGFFHAGFALS